MKAVIFCFLIIGFINDLYGQNPQNPISQLKMDTINYSHSENLHPKLSPIHSNMSNYRYSNHTNKEARYAISITLKIILRGLIGSYVPTPTHIRDSEQDKILKKVRTNFYAGNYVEGRQILEQNTEILMDTTTVFLDVDYYYNLATFYKFIGSYDKALEICEKSIETLKKQLSYKRVLIKYQKLQTLAEIYSLSGEIYHVNGSYIVALDFYIKALLTLDSEDVIITNFTKRTIARICNNIGNAYYGLSSYSDAPRYYDIVR